MMANAGYRHCPTAALPEGRLLDSKKLRRCSKVGWWAGVGTASNGAGRRRRQRCQV